MASELRVDTLKDSSGNNSVGMAYVAEGSGKAWANYSGSGTTFRDSFNCTSATDNGTGDYTTTFTNAMNNDDYSFSAGMRLDSSANAAYNSRGIEFKTLATGSIRFVCQIGSASAYDFDHTCPQIMGDLA